MSRFYVGQRVRLVRPVQPENLGLEGHISALFPDKSPGLVDGLGWNCDVVWDDRPIRGHMCDTAQLEPIFPEGHRAGDYSLSDLLDRCRAGEGVAA